MGLTKVEIELVITLLKLLPAVVFFGCLLYLILNSHIPLGELGNLWGAVNPDTKLIFIGLLFIGFMK